MKKIFFISCVAISAMALSTSANTNKYYYCSDIAVGKDTTPPMVTDSMHHGTMRMHKKEKPLKDSSASGMHSDSTSTTTPPKN